MRYKTNRCLFLLLAFLFLVSPTFAEQVESRKPATVRAFKKAHGLIKVGSGQIDHCTPLMCGGSDEQNNMQFICGKEKDLKERLERLCSIHFQCKTREENLKSMKTCPGTVLRSNQ